MKRTLRYAFSLILSLAALAQQSTQSAPAPTDTPYSVVRQDGNQRVWQHATWIPDPFGSFTPVTNFYTEIQTAMAHLVNGQGVDSSDQIQVMATGAQVEAEVSIIFSRDSKNTSGWFWEAFEPRLNARSRLRENEAHLDIGTRLVRDRSRAPQTTKEDYE